jgi:hypothetical protein
VRQGGGPVRQAAGYPYAGAAGVSCAGLQRSWCVVLG